MNKLFDRIFFHNNTTPALNESNLNSMSKAIDDIDDRIIEIASTIMETVPQVLELYDDIEALAQNPPKIGTNGDWYIWDTETGAYVDSGIDASVTVEIADVTMLAPDATPYVTNTGTNTDPIFHLFIPRGYKGDTGATGATPNITMSATADATSSANPTVNVTKSGTAENPVFVFAFSGLKGTKGDTGNTGPTGNGIASVVKTGTSGLVDTYTITFTDGTITTFTVTNGTAGTSDWDNITNKPDVLIDELTTTPSGVAVGYGKAELGYKKADGYHYIKLSVNGWSDVYLSNDSAETAIDDDDYFPFYDSSATAKRKTLWSNIKSVLKTYFDTIYSTFSGSYNDLTNKPALDDWVATASVSSGAFSVTVDDTQGYAYKPYFVVDGNSTNLNPSYEISSISGAGTASCTITYTTDADNGTNNVKIRRIK